MKFTTSTLLSTTLLTTALAVTPSTTKTYQLRVSSKTPALNNSVVTVQDGGLTTSPNPIGVFSTGEPRVPYTFTFATSPISSIVYELKGALKATHLIATGNPIARGLFDVPIGADPKPAEGEEQNTMTWMATDSQTEGAMNLYLGENKFKNDGTTQSDFMSAGSMRACLGESDVDYRFYWFDGLNDLGKVIKGCESVSLQVEEVSSAVVTAPASITGVPAPTQTGSGFLTGVTAPATTTTTGGNGTATGKPTPSDFPGVGSHAKVAGSLLGAAVGVAAVLL